MKGTILGTVRKRATPIERDVGGGWERKFRPVPFIKKTSEWGTHLPKSYYDEYVSSNDFETFPFFLHTGLVFNFMTSKQVRAMLDNQIKDLYATRQIEYKYTGQFFISFNSEDLILRAGGSISRESAKFLVTGFNISSETAEWINGIVNSYYAIMRSITENKQDYELNNNKTIGYQP